jgi:YesN/AraC family two-component response regulator
MESAPDKKLNAVWLDLTLSTVQSELPSIFYDHCKIQTCDNVDVLRPRLKNSKQDLVIVDFDYPSKIDLARVADLKIEFPSIPMLILTVQHSESLAVWAFRSRFLDYIAKPVSRTEAEHCLRRLEEIAHWRGLQTERVVVNRRESVPQEANATKKDSGHRSLVPAISFVEKNFRSRVINEDVAAECGMNPFYFSKRFKETYAIGFHEYLTRYRLREARRLLEIPSVSITQVCFSCGFNDASHFTRVFKKYFGALPSSYIGKPLKEKFEDEICPEYSPVPKNTKGKG